MKKKMMIKVLSVLSIASAAFIFAGCGKSQKTEPKPIDDEIKYDSNLKMKYKVSANNAEIVEIEKQGTTLNIPSEIGGKTVTRVSCTYTDDELTTVNIPSSLKYLTGNGFMNCKNLTTVNFASGSQLTDIPSKAFLGTKLSSITIPASVKTISFEAFQEVDTLTSVTFENKSSLQAIGPFAFYGCDGITSFDLPSELLKIGESAFEKCENLTDLTISNATKLTEIEQYAFSGCYGLTSLDFTNNVTLTTIGANAFRGCYNISSVTFDEAIKEIGSKAFYNTQKITDLVLPQNLTKIGDEAFVNAGLVSLELKSGSDTTFGTNVFSQYELVDGTLIPLEKITTITVNGNLSLEKIFSDYAKQVRLSLTNINVTGDRIDANAYKGCVNLTSITIDPKIVAIGASAFEDCASITTITLPEKTSDNDGLTEIANNTFKNCTSLSNITLPNSIKTVRDGAFDGCINVGNLDLSNLVFIGAYAFRNTKVGTQTFSENLVEIGTGAFEDCINIDGVVVNTTTNNTVIRQYAFRNCTDISSISLSSNVVVENNVFENDINVVALTVKGEYGLETLFGKSREEVSKKIASITIQEGTEIIESNAFNGCLLVESINIPSSVKEIGDSAFKGCKGIETLDLTHSNLTKVGKYAFADCEKLIIDELPEGIVDISEGLFQNDFAITTFKLNSGVTRIGNYAFSGCSNLEIKTIDDEDNEVNELNDSITFIGNYAFSECANLKLSKLPDQLTELGKYAFSGCFLITIKKTTGGLIRIGDSAFKGCQAITSFEFENDLGNGRIGNAVLEGCTKIEELKIYGSTSLESLFGEESVSALKPILSNITIKEGSTELTDNMFKGFSAIKNVVFESEIEAIGAGAFEGCTSLVAIDLSTVRVVRDRAFADSGLESVVIPANGIFLGSDVFNGCLALSKVTFEEATDEGLSITSISKGLFANTIIENIAIPATVKKIGEAAFSKIPTLNTVSFGTLEKESVLTEIGANAFNGCSNILEIDIPKTVTIIGPNAFQECHALRTVNFVSGNKISLIDEYTFASCYALTDINLPSTIREIKMYAFSDCSCLARITLPADLDKIGESAFAGAVSLNKLVIPAKIEIINKETFKDCYMLEDVTWNANIKTIYDGAFCNTPYKTVIPKTVSYIGASAFATTDADKYPVTFEGEDIELGCIEDGVGLYISDLAFSKSGVHKVTFGAKITDMGNSVFKESSIEIVDFRNIKITKIGDSMFDTCESLASVILKDTEVTNKTINTVGDSAFKQCKALGSFLFENILSIGDNAFEETIALLIDISLGEDTNISIGSKAFYKSGIKSIKLGEHVIKLGDNAVAESKITSADLEDLNITAISDNFFADCVNLTSVKVNKLIRTIGSSAFNGCQALANIDFINQEGMVLEKIMDSAFEGCETLTSVTIPNTVSFVGPSAFKDCTGLTSIEWSTSANVIYDNTFNGCNSLNNVTIPENVSRIGQYAFTPTSAGTYIFLSPVAPSLDPDFCVGYKNISFKVPVGKLDLYLENYVFYKMDKEEHNVSENN